MRKFTLLLTMVLGVFAANGQSCDDLFFSEYGEGSSNHKYIEIYNPSASAISLTGYTVYMSGNGGSYTNTFTTNATIASGDVYVVSTNQADTLIQAEADTVLGYPSIVHFNGDDALILYDGTDTIDVIGVPGVDPGSSWAVGTGSTANHTLVRKSSVTGGSTNWTTGATEWDVYSQNTWTYIGSHSSSCIVTPYVVTFMVNTANITVGTNGLYLGGGVIGGANAVQLADPDGDGVYVGTDTLNGSNGGNFIFLNSPANASDWNAKENLANLPCADAANYNDRILPTFSQDTTLMFCFGTCSTDTSCTVTSTNVDVTFRVDMNSVSASFTNVYVSGTLNSWSGNANQLTDPDGDGVYEADISLAPGSYEYKFTYDNWVGQESLDATLDSACTLTTGSFTNRYVTIPNATTVLPVVCWESCMSCPVVSTGCDELYFSEYGEGSSNHKYIEIYNPTANAISLTGYTVYMSGNGGSYTNTFTTNATIASGDVYVVSTNQADSLIQAEADTVLGYPSIVHFNGDDALILYNGTDTVDVIGVPGVDPGSSWAVGTGSTANHTLVRKDSVTGGSTNWTTGATEWDVYASNTWTYVGSHSSSCIASNVDVTFQVDMNNVTASYTNVYVSGTINGWSGNSNQLTDSNGDGVYEGVLSLMPGSYEYKFTYDNWVGQESLDATLDSACTLTTGSFTNRYVTIPNATTVLPVVCWEECSSCAIVVTGCDELYFSEYGEGSSNHKYIEIYNPTANAVSLTGYTVYMSGNGGSYTNTFTTNATIASGDVYVVSTNQADSLIQAEADTVLGYPSIVHFNGDDALILYNGTDTVDVIGVPGVDPGSSWAVGTGSTANYTLVRKNSITEGSIDWTTGATEWDVYAQNTWTYVGSHSSSCITVVVPTGCSELYFSEYAEGSSNHKYIEIYNPTANAVSLTGYTVYQSGNGGSYTNTFTTNASIASGDVYLISTNQADASILAVADTALAYPSIAHFNGDDAMILFNGTDTVDVIGVPGVDPGSSWIVDTGSTANYTLVRKDSVTGGSTNWTTGATQWDVYPQNTWTNAGSHTSSCIVITIPNVTFRVDMNNVTASYTNVYVSGTINGWSGNANQLTDANGDGVYEGTIPLTAGSYEYKFTYDNWVGQESLDATLDSACTLTTSGFTNRYVTIPNANTVLPVVCWEDCSSCPVYAPTYTIANIDGIDADGVADSLNVYCKLVGTVMGVDMQGAATMVQFTIHDGTGGMGVFSSVATAQNYTVTEGDQVRMIGSIGQFNGLTQMYPDSIVFISAGNTLPTAVVVTALGESTESELVTFENMVLVDPSQWSGSGSGFNVDATNGTDTIAVRIDNDVDLYSQPAPTGTFNVSGIGGQYDSSLPHLSGYQLLPRYIADIVPGQPAYSPKLVVSEIMSGSNASAWAADWFEIHNYGDTVVDLTGFSWDDESGISGTSVFPALSIAAGEAIVVWNDVAANEDSLLVSWKLTAGSVQVISTDELNGSFPSLSQNGDGVYLFDASGTDLTNSLYLSATAGYTVEFDTTGMATGVAVDGVNGAYTSSLGDVGSPGNLAPNQNVGELGLMGRIYPNPTTGSFQIEMKQADRYAVEVMDIRGVVLTTVSVEGSVIPVELNASAGMYLVRVTSAKGTVTQRIQLL